MKRKAKTTAKNLDAFWEEYQKILLDQGHFPDTIQLAHKAFYNGAQCALFCAHDRNVGANYMATSAQIKVYMEK